MSTPPNHEHGPIASTSTLCPVSQDALQPVLSEETPAVLSKSQQKKRQREAQRLAGKAERRARERAARKEKRAGKRKLVEEEGADPVELGLVKRPRYVEHPEPFDATVVIDLSFDDKMTDKDIRSMSTQLSHVYSVNRQAKHPLRIICTPLDGKLEARMSTAGQDQHLRWKGIEFRSTQLSDLWSAPDGVDGKEVHSEDIHTIKQEDVVYLTADSPNALHKLDEGSTYIIGGIVDHNKYKNLCYNIAQDLKIRHAALPIGEYIDMATRKVLTVNQCFDIMTKWLEYRDWEKAFFEVIPKRKFEKPAQETERASRDGDDEKLPPETVSSGSMHSGEVSTMPKEIH